MRRNLNFSNPLQGRRWLSLLQHDSRFGIRILPDLTLSRRVLGFTFRSNSLGLRGPSNLYASKVILGTSFAMGFAVDSGLNWYELALNDSDWLNLGLPVGIHQTEAMLNYFHKGDGSTALFLYHPNIWSLTKAYGKNVLDRTEFFARMRWQTKISQCLALRIQKYLKDRKKLKTGVALRIQHDSRTYNIDCNYANFDFKSGEDCASKTIDGICRFAKRFENMLILRIPTKEELIPSRHINLQLEQMQEICNHGWLLLNQALARLPGVILCDPSPLFSLSDYHPCDTHWNESGNRKFANYIASLIQDQHLVA